MKVSRLPFRVKICGVTSVHDAEMIVAYGADAIGLNFYSKSPRSVSVEIATRIAEAVAGKVCLVGVFVNHSVAEIESIRRSVGLDVIQLHGDEPSSYLRSLETDKVVRAVRSRDDDWRAIDEQLEPWVADEASLIALLIDAYSTTEFGGTGKTIDWNSIRDRIGSLSRAPIVLAGGLNEENITEAILAARPDAVDTASGVEEKPGIKSSLKVGRFVTRAKSAFERLDVS